MVALVDGQPRLLNLKEVLSLFSGIGARWSLAERHLLRKARERGHVLEGLAVALANIDAVIELIKTSLPPQKPKKSWCASLEFR